MTDSISGTSLFVQLVQLLVLTGPSLCQKVAQSFSFLISQSLQQNNEAWKKRNQSKLQKKKTVESGKGW